MTATCRTPDAVSTTSASTPPVAGELARRPACRATPTREPRIAAEREAAAAVEREVGARRAAAGQTAPRSRRAGCARRSAAGSDDRRHRRARPARSRAWPRRRAPGRPAGRARFPAAGPAGGAGGPVDRHRHSSALSRTGPAETHSEKPSSPTSGTNRHGTERTTAGPSGLRTTTWSSCPRRPPTGTTSRPRGSSCSYSVGGRRGAAAATAIAAYGACSGSPSVPSPTCTLTRVVARLGERRPCALRELGHPLDRVHLAGELRQHRRLVARPGADVEHALAAAEGQRLADAGDHVRLRDRLARRRSAAPRRRRHGPAAPRRRTARAARAASPASTRSSVMSRPRSCRSTMRSRSSSALCDARHVIPRIARRSDAEVLEHERGDVDDARRLALDARRSASAPPSRPAASEPWLPPPTWCRPPRSANSKPGVAETSSVARVRIVERGPGRARARRAGRAATRRPTSPSLLERHEPKLLALASRDRVAVLEEEGDLDALVAVEPRRERGGALATAVEAVDHPGAVRRRHEDGVDARRIATPAERTAPRVSVRGPSRARRRSARGTRPGRRPRRAAWRRTGRRRPAPPAAASGPCRCEAKS